MKFKSVVAGVLGALALGGLSGTVSAAPPVNLGPATIGVPLTFGGGAPVGSFIDDFLFSLPNNGGSGYSVLNFAPAFLDGSFNTVFSMLALYSDPNGDPWSGDEKLVASAAGSGGSISFTWGPSAGGNMILQVAGATNGSLGGLYTGGIQVSPVPEPATWAMMATGAILLGFGLRRNRS